MKEVICYGDILRFRNAATPREFYARLGLLTRLENGGIASVSQLQMNPEDHEALRTMLVKELIRRNAAFSPERIRAAAGVLWLDQGPAVSEEIPPGELWVMMEGAS